MVWIYRYLCAGGGEVDMGPYTTREEADEHRKAHAGFGAMVSEEPIEVPDNYELRKNTD